MKKVNTNKKKINNSFKRNSFLSWFKLDSLLFIYILLLPIFDSSSFIFKDILNYRLSPSTIIRPLYLVFMIIILFLKLREREKINNCKKKWYESYLGKFILYTIFVLIYSVIHVYIFKENREGITIYPLQEEIRYILYYAFNSYIFLLGICYLKEIKKDNKKMEIVKERLPLFIILCASFYLSVLYISFLTKTASYTYLDSKVGFKGFFASGNVISNILIILEIILLMVFEDTKIKKNKYLKVSSFVLICLNFIYMFIILGTRTGKYGSILILFMYFFFKTFEYLKKKLTSKEKINLLILVMIFSLLILISIFNKGIKLPSDTRREYLEKEQKQLVDQNNCPLSVTLDMHNLNIKIKKGEISSDFLSKVEQKSLLETEEIAIKKGLIGHERRKTQTIYNMRLVLNEKNLVKILFGKGHLITYPEMILERELLAIILDFGIMGFLLFLLPFLIVLLKFMHLIIYNWKIKVRNCLFLFGVFLIFGLSYFEGAIFFPLSSGFLISLLYWYFYLPQDINFN